LFGGVPNVRVIVIVSGMAGLLHAHLSDMGRITDYYLSYDPGDCSLRTIASWETSLRAVMPLPGRAPAMQRDGQ
jgi:hypothetical protein